MDIARYFDNTGCIPLVSRKSYVPRLIPEIHSFCVSVPCNGFLQFRGMTSFPSCSVCRADKQERKNNKQSHRCQTNPSFFPHSSQSVNTTFHMDYFRNDFFTLFLYIFTIHIIDQAIPNPFHAQCVKHCIEISGLFISFHIFWRFF